VVVVGLAVVAAEVAIVTFVSKVIIDPSDPVMVPSVCSWLATKSLANWTATSAAVGLGQLKKLRRLAVNQCDEMLELSGAKHLILLKTLWVWGCPKLRWGEGELEQLHQRLKAGLNIT